MTIFTNLSVGYRLKGVLFRLTVAKVDTLFSFLWLGGFASGFSELLSYKLSNFPRAKIN